MTKRKRQLNGVWEDADSESAEDQYWQVEPDVAVAVLREDTDTKKRVYDLEEQTAQFGETIIRFAKMIPHGPVNNRLIDQLVGAGTSVGANYCEADDGITKKDFLHRTGICKKEARETKFFLRMIATAEPEFKPEARDCWKEARELHLIFCSIWRKGRRNEK